MPTEDITDFLDSFSTDMSSKNQILGRFLHWQMTGDDCPTPRASTQVALINRAQGQSWKISYPTVSLKIQEIGKK